MFAKTAFLIIITFATAANAKCTVVNGINKCRMIKSGDIKINDLTEEPEKVSFVLRENKMSGFLSLHHANIYDDDHYKDVVKGEFVFENASNEKNYMQYQVILKGKNGLIAKTTGDMIVPSGTSQPMRMGNVPLSIREINNISSYEIKCVSSNIKLHRK